MLENVRYWRPVTNANEIELNRQEEDFYGLTGVGNRYEGVRVVFRERRAGTRDYHSLVGGEALALDNFRRRLISDGFPQEE